MKLTLGEANATTATICQDDGTPIANITCPEAAAVAEKIVRSFYYHDALIGAVSALRRDDLGGQLCGMIDLREAGAKEAGERLEQLVSMVDVLTDHADETRDDR
ncbi:hypothetical protein [Bradyrhizobium sp. 170]|uniref:hypothetical protein n=1 Tax=Bradyrhizobium sp. 170 TaxID=2782641 RepID=UPI001FFF63D0|nr:hypothetical protein [Bradyrhizobium sp. 170]UPK03082.1 hypothetical protein IVB05_36990 [Bradyrhizobium sp. 170]